MMTRPRLPRALRAVSASAALFGVLAVPASAQGTREQQEACTPDAVRLCADTIPDIGRTTACMKAHAAELSPRCRRVAFPDAGVPARRERRVSREAPPPDDGYGARQYEYLEPDGRPARAHVRREPLPDDDQAPVARRYVAPPDADDADEDVDRTRAVIGRLCDDEALDEASCAATQRALDRVGQ